MAKTELKTWLRPPTVQGERNKPEKVIEIILLSINPEQYPEVKPVEEKLLTIKPPLTIPGLLA
jgi:hypothetical protein